MLISLSQLITKTIVFSYPVNQWPILFLKREEYAYCLWDNRNVIAGIM